MQRFVARPVPHAEEITEEIDEAEMRATAFDCGIGRD